MKAWGTGVLTASYPSGAIKCRHWFTAGTLRKSEWYKPDGTIVAREKAYPDAYSRFYFLRDDGSISADGFVYDQTLDGPWFHYDEEGNVVRIERLIGGLSMLYWKDDKRSEKSEPPSNGQQGDRAASPSRPSGSSDSSAASIPSPDLEAGRIRNAEPSDAADSR
jgi:hypothetical protein